MKRLLEILSTAGAIALVGCSPGPNEGGQTTGAATTNGMPGEMVRRAPEPSPAGAGAAVQADDGLVAATSAKLTEWNGKLSDLRQKAEVLSGEAKDQANQALDSLRDKYATAAQKLDALKKSAREAWPEAKAGLDAAIADLEQAYNNAKAKFEKSQ